LDNYQDICQNKAKMMINLAKIRPFADKCRVLYVFVAFSVIIACKKEQRPVTGKPDPSKPEEELTTRIQVNRAQKRQFIDGFGFFGAQSVWWDANRSNLFSEAWATQVIEDLGISIWRNEYYPPATALQGQDADWDKQKPVVEGPCQNSCSEKSASQVYFYRMVTSGHIQVCGRPQ
jgi:hypothetical protein